MHVVELAEVQLIVRTNVRPQLCFAAQSTLASPVRTLNLLKEGRKLQIFLHKPNPNAV